MRAWRQGFTLLEVVMAAAIFLMILGISFLPFKMLSGALSEGSGHIDAGQAARIALQQMVRDIRRGGMPLPSGTQMFGGSQASYQKITYTYNPEGYGEPVQYSYYLEPVTVASPGVAGDVNGGGEALGGGTEYRLMEDAHATSGVAPVSASLAGYPKAVIARGVWEFYVRPGTRGDDPNSSLYSPLPSYPPSVEPTSTAGTPAVGWDRQYIIVYAAVAPANDRRPLPAPPEAPAGLLQFSTEFSMRNVPVLP